MEHLSSRRGDCEGHGQALQNGVRADELPSTRVPRDHGVVQFHPRAVRVLPGLGGAAARAKVVGAHDDSVRGEEEENEEHGRGL